MTARLRETYKNEVFPALKEKFQYENVMEVPKLVKVTFNMGLGMVLAVSPEDVDKTMEAVRSAGETPYVVGRVEAGEKGVDLC